MGETTAQPGGLQTPLAVAGGTGAGTSGPMPTGLVGQGGVAEGAGASRASAGEEGAPHSASQAAPPAVAAEGPTTQGAAQTADEPGTAGGHAPGDYSFALPEGVAADPQLTGRFREFCAGAGLTPEQAQAAVGFWLDESRAGQEQALTRCETALRARWGAAYENRLDAARGSLRVLDERMEGRLATLAQSGLGNAPEFVELMAHLAEALGEDSLGAVRGGGGGHEAQLSTEEFLKTVVFKR